MICFLLLRGQYCIYIYLTALSDTLQIELYIPSLYKSSIHFFPLIYHICICFVSSPMKKYSSNHSASYIDIVVIDKRTTRYKRVAVYELQKSPFLFDHFIVQYMPQQMLTTTWRRFNNLSYGFQWAIAHYSPIRKIKEENRKLENQEEIDAWKKILFVYQCT